MLINFVTLLYYLGRTIIILAVFYSLEWIKNRMSGLSLVHRGGCSLGLLVIISKLIFSVLAGIRNSNVVLIMLM